MKSIKTYLFLLSLVLFINCSINNNKTKIIVNNDYELRLAPNSKVTLILFPCYFCDIEHTKKEALFLKDLDKVGISTLIVNDNQKLFLKDGDKLNITNKLNKIFRLYNIPLNNVYMGGFSSGGNIVMLLANDLIKHNNQLQPKGIFIVDSPIDLEKLYYNAIKDIKNNKNTSAVEEGNFLINLLNTELGSPKNNLSVYKEYSPFLTSQNIQKNTEYLNHIKIRFYTEPDLNWQNENRNRTYEDLNAFVLEKASISLNESGNRNTEFIKTLNRGIKADGSKHSHSWNLVEREGLMQWLLK